MVNSSFRFLSLTLTLCTALLGCHPTPPIAPPRADAHALSALDALRIHAAYEASFRAIAPWEIPSSGNDCTLLFAEREEWLIGCGAQVDGFEPTGTSVGDLPVLYAPRSLFLSGSEMPYAEIHTAIVGTVGTREHEGATSPVLIVQAWDALHANHPGFSESNVSEWYGVFVHEGFHARQMAHPRVREAMAEVAQSAITPDTLAEHFRENEAYQAAVRAEFQLLHEAAATTSDAASAARALQAWAALHDARVSLLETAFPGQHAGQADAFFTFLEGTARFVEASFLTSARDAVPAQERPAFEGLHQVPIWTLPGLSGLGPKYYYALGMYLSILLDRCAPDWRKRALSTDGLLIGLVRTQTSA